MFDVAAYVLRSLAPSGLVTTVAGLPSTQGNVDGVGSAARFGTVFSLACAPFGGWAVLADTLHGKVRRFSFASNYSATFAVLASVSSVGVALDGGVFAFASGYMYAVSASGATTALAGSAPGGAVDGTGAAAKFQGATYSKLLVDAGGTILFPDTNNWKVRKITQNGTANAAAVLTIAGSGLTGQAAGYGAAATFTSAKLGAVLNASQGPVVFLADQTLVRSLSCGLCPRGSYCSGAAPFTVVQCPAGNYCPAGAAAPTPCPPGAYAPAGSGSATACIPCAPGFFCPAGADYPQPCPAGTFSGGAGGFASASCGGNCSAAPGWGCAAAWAGGPAGAPCPAGFFCAGGAAGPAACACPGACASSGLSYDAFNTTAGTNWAVAALTGLAGAVGHAGGAGAVSNFNYPTGVGLNGSSLLLNISAGATPAGTAAGLFVADAVGTLIRAVSLPSGQTGDLAGTYWTAGFSDGQGPGVMLTWPNTVAGDGTGVSWVLDGPSSGGNRIRRVSAGGAVSTLAGTVGPIVASFGFLPLPMPTGNESVSFLVTTASDMVYGCNIRRYNAPGNTWALVAGKSGAFACVRTDGALGTGNFGLPFAAIALDPAGSGAVWALDSHTLRRVDSTGAITTVAGTGVAGFLDGAAGTAKFNFPRALVVDTSGAVYVSDWGNCRVRRFATGAVFSVAGSGCSASAPFSLVGYSSAVRLFNNWGLTSDPNSGIQYVVEQGTGVASGFVRTLACGMCPAGSYCPSAYAAPAACLVGAFCPAGSSAPTPCTPGFHCPSPNMSTPAPCPPGTQAPVAGATACAPCAPGTFSSGPATGTLACAYCAPGTQSVGGAAACAPCNAGYFCGGGTPGPWGVRCGAGNYCPTGSTVPQACPSLDAMLGPANGPAFDVDTAACYIHCFSGGPGQTSAC